MSSPATRRTWRWLELALVTAALLAILFAFLPFTMDRRVAVQPPSFPIDHQSAIRSPYTELWHIRCDTGGVGDRFVSEGGDTIFFNEVTPVPVQRPSSLCDPARVEHRQGLATLSVVIFAAAILLLVGRRNRERRQPVQPSSAENANRADPDEGIRPEQRSVRIRPAGSRAPRTSR